MSKAREDQLLVPSVLDRLLDDHPEQRQELPKARHQVLRELKQSVRRDLENLLNTRWRCVSWPPNLDELELSLVNYGIPDFTGVNMGSPAERDRFAACDRANHTQVRTEVQNRQGSDAGQS